MFFLYFLLTLVILSIIVVFHEGGHYIAARLNGITVLEFSVGMGPCICSHVSKKTNIKYSLRLLPIGGYVSMAGEDDESDDENAFYKKSVWRRLLTTFAGPFMNFVIGFIGMCVLVLFTTPLASNTVAGFQDGAVSPDCGLRKGDTITAINNVTVHTGNELVYEIMNQGYKPLDITVIRDGEKVILNGVTFPTMSEEGATFGNYDFIMLAEESTAANIAKHSFWRSVSTVKMIWDSLADLIRGRYGVDSLSGPVGITQSVSEAAKSSWQSLLYLSVIISINLGVMNLLPFPALDGGRILLLIIEAVLRRPLNKNIEGYINFIGLALLMILMLIITAKDIIKLF